jgi:hypothetical protein
MVKASRCSVLACEKMSDGWQIMYSKRGSCGLWNKAGVLPWSVQTVHV